MQYLITKEQRDTLLANHLLLKHETDILQSLPVLEGEPAAYRLPDPDVNKKHHYFDLNEVEHVKHVLEALYTHPAPFTPIAADEKITQLQAKVEALRKDAAWIPVIERLPETTTPTLLIRNSDGYIDTDWFCHLRKGFSYYEGRVTHWMPLPKPPIAGEAT